jgi:hypothetical protein
MGLIAGTGHDGAWTADGAAAWECGVPTRNSDPARLDGPLTDGPAFDRDGSRMLWGTALSGDLAARVESELVSPPIDASGCAGGRLKLGFWHWYHFGPGAGGFVQVFDGARWVDVEPTGGYPGAIGGGLPWRAAYGHEAFVSAEDAPSGWRYTMFDISAHAVSNLRLRFVVSSDNGRTRPGWYVDTIEIVRDGMDAVTPLEGDPELPNCGLAPHALDERALRRDVERDPCLHGEPLLDPARLVHEPGEDGGPSTHRFTLDVPVTGSLCVSITNGEERVDRATAAFASAVVRPAGRLDRLTASSRKVLPAAGGGHDLVVELEGAAGSAVEVSVFHLPGDANVPVFDAAGLFTGLSDFVVGYHDEPRPGSDPSRPVTLRLWDIAFDVELPMKSYGVEGLESAVSYVVQIMDPGTCQQVREIRGWQGLTGGSRGFHQGPVQVRLRWDGTGDDGGFLDTSRSYLFRVIAAPGDIETFPPGWIEPIGGNGGSPSLPGFISADVKPMPFEWLQIFQTAGVAAIGNRHYPQLLGANPIKAAGGEKISVGVFVPSEVYVSDAPVGYFAAIDGEGGYEKCPQGWDCAADGPYPFVVGTWNILKLTRLMLKQNISSSEEQINGFPLTPSPFQTYEVLSNGCGTDIYGNAVCAEVTVAATVPKKTQFYVHGKTVPGPRLEAYLVHKDGYDSHLPTGIPQTQVVPVAWPVISSVANDKALLGNVVRWDDAVKLLGKHLYSYIRPDLPVDVADNFGVSLCLHDEGEVSSIEPLILEAQNTWLPSLFLERFVMPTRDFATEGFVPLVTNVAVTGVFGPEGCGSSGSQVFGSGAIMKLTPPIVEDVLALDVSQDAIMTLNWPMWPEDEVPMPWNNNHQVTIKQEPGATFLHYFEGGYLQADLISTNPSPFSIDYDNVLVKKLGQVVFEEITSYDTYEIIFRFQGPNSFWSDLAHARNLLLNPPPFFPIKAQLSEPPTTWEVMPSSLLIKKLIPGLCTEPGPNENCTQWYLDVPEIPSEVASVSAWGYHLPVPTEPITSPVCWGPGETGVFPRGFYRQTSVPVGGMPIEEIDWTAHCENSGECGQGDDHSAYCKLNIERCATFNYPENSGWVEKGLSAGICG